MKLCMDDLYGVNAELCRRAIITLDGVKVAFCLEADEEQGYIERIDMENGRPIVYEHAILTVCEYGKVRIIDPLTIDLAEVYLK